MWWMKLSPLRNRTLRNKTKPEASFKICKLARFALFPFLALPSPPYSASRRRAPPPRLRDASSTTSHLRHPLRPLVRLARRPRERRRRG